MGREGRPGGDQIARRLRDAQEVAVRGEPEQPLVASPMRRM